MSSIEASSKPTFNKKNPCLAKLDRAVVLTGDGSGKDTRHFEIDLCGSGLEFLPGDSLAVQAKNDPQWVDQLLAVLSFTGDEKPNGEKTLREQLISDYTITAPSKKFLKAVAEKTGENSNLSILLRPESKKDLETYLWGRWIVDVLESIPGIAFTPEEFVGLLSKLNVRLYSIASSLAANPDSVHLTVATVEYETNGRQRGGVCSTWLAHRIEVGETIPCFITPGKGFRLPAPEDDSPIVMCGPGTGIAPFRAFLQHRQATNAKGDTWLFFGEQHEASDFFYKEEWEDYLSDGTLTRIDTAFSRDQDHKIYVQHRMLERGRDLWEWLERGALFYVCGDASRMAVDVDEALHRIVSEHGGKTEEEATAYVQGLKDEKRYRRDVY